MVLVEQACTDAIRPLAVCENHKDVTSPVLKMTTPAAIQRILLIVCCATFDVEDTVAWTNNEVGDFTNGELALARTDDARVAHARAAAELLAEPLGRDRAVRLALLNSADGYELELEIPLFDWGGMQRAGSNARVLAAANTYEATLRAAASLLRESYSAYRTSFDITTHYRDEILPLVETISEENVLRYNCIFIGVFELLADSRTAIDAVMAAIDAQRQFWSAEAALKASITGRPMMADVAAVGVGDGGDGEAH